MQGMKFARKPKLTPQQIEHTREQIDKRKRREDAAARISPWSWSSDSPDTERDSLIRSLGSHVIPAQTGIHWTDDGSPLSRGRRRG